MNNRDKRKALNKKLSSDSFFQVNNLGLRVSPKGTGKKVRAKARKGTAGRYTLAFMNTFEGMTEHQLDIKEKYALNLIANYMGMDAKFFRLEPVKAIPTVLGGDYTYKVSQGDYTIGKLSISITITRLTGKSMCVIFNERNVKTRKAKKRK